jgi:bacterioferritin-associated ferredoxin
VQRCLRPRADEWGATTVRDVFIAGDGGGIAGAQAAEHSGSLAALAAGYALRAIDVTARDEHAAAHRASLARCTRPRRVKDVEKAPAREFRIAADDTIVCRCEEVTARQIRDAVSLGGMGPNQLKAYVRCGMGPCQGRLCGLAVTELVADTRGVSPRSVGYYRLRFPIKPLTLGELASLPQTEASRRAVVRLPD